MASQVFAWLADEYASVRLRDGIGVVHAMNEEDFADQAAQAMEPHPAAGVLGWLQTLPEQMTQIDRMHWWGLMAMIYLLELYDPTAKIDFEVVDRSTGNLSATILQATQRDTLPLCFLERAGVRDLLGVIDETYLVHPTPYRKDLSEALGDLIPWYDAEKKCFVDPVPFLGPRECRLLKARLSLKPCPGLEGLRKALDQAMLARETSILKEQTATWHPCMKACLGWRDENFGGALTALAKPQQSVHAHAVLKFFGVTEEERILPEEYTYLWQGRPFFVTDPSYLFVFLPGDEARSASRGCALEEELLEKYSRAYDEQLLFVMQTKTDTLQWHPQVKQLFDLSMQRLAQLHARPLPGLEMRYPWREASPALYGLLRERLGEKWAHAALHFFSDRIVLLQKGTLGEDRLDHQWMVTMEEQICVCVPPFSEKVCEVYAQNPDVFDIDHAQIQVLEHGDLRVSVVLDHEGQRVTLTRVYQSMEQVMLSGDDVPEVHLWPKIPLPQDAWHAYVLSLHGRMEVRAWHAEGAPSLEMTEDRARTQTMRLTAYPSCLSLRRGAQSLGFLPLRAMVYAVDRTEGAIGIAISESGIGLALCQGETSEPMAIPVLSQRLMGGEVYHEIPFPLYDIAGRLTGSTLVSHVSKTQQVFENGFIASDGRYAYGTVYALMRTDPEASSARMIRFQEALLMAAFHASMHGCQKAKVYVALPSSLAQTDTDWLEEEWRSACEAVEAWTGMTLLLQGPFGRRASMWTLGMRRGMDSALCTLCMEDTEWTVCCALPGSVMPVCEVVTNPSLSQTMLDLCMQYPDLIVQEMRQLPGFPFERLRACVSGASQTPGDWEESMRLMDIAFDACLTDTAQSMNRLYAEGNMLYLHARWVLEVLKAMTLAGAAIVESMQRCGGEVPLHMPLYVTGERRLQFALLDPTIRYQASRFAQLPLELMNVRVPIQTAVDASVEPHDAVACARGGNGEVLLHDLSQFLPLDVLLTHFLMLLYASMPACASVLFPGRFIQSGLISTQTQAQIYDLAYKCREMPLTEALDVSLQALVVSYVPKAILEDSFNPSVPGETDHRLT